MRDHVQPRLSGTVPLDCPSPSCLMAKSQVSIPQG